MWGAAFFAAGAVIAALLFRRKGDGLSVATHGQASTDAAAEPVVAH
jgi:hypothetical protein